MLRLASSKVICATLAIAATSMVTLAAPMLAQNRPVVFIHGLFQDNREWQGTANYLAQLYQVEPIVPTVGWGNTYESQGANLSTALGSRTQVAAMGHSNGGLVERSYIRQFGAGTHINRGFTLGTPHRGSQLAAYVEDGTVGNYAGYLLFTIADPFNFYYDNDQDFRDAVSFGGTVPIIHGVFVVMAYVANHLVSIVNQVAIPAVSDALPVSREMIPTSAFLASINSPENLSAEQANVPTRISAATSIRPQGSFFRALSTDPGRWESYRRGAEYLALLMYNHYSAHSDFYLQVNAYRWLELAAAMENLDVNWLFLIGAVTDVDENTGVVYVDRQDGLVPLSSQTWPGATLQRNLFCPDVCIPHLAQVTHPSTISMMGDVLRVDFAISLKPPPLTTSLSGPSTIEEYAYGTWNASSTGGTPPYSYQWTTDGYYAGTGSSLTDGGWGGGSSHTIVYTVTDAAGQTASDWISVYVTGSGGCIYPPCPR